MAKQKEEAQEVQEVQGMQEEETNNVNIDIDIDENAIDSIEPIEMNKEEKKEVKREQKEERHYNNMDSTTNKKINCLRNERVIVRYIPKQYGGITNPKHVLYGRFAENSYRSLTVPRLTSGTFVNVLTDSEKEFLEDIMGLEQNALSVYKRENNFWDDGNDFGISKVILYKQDNYLDLSVPEDYIRYKILLANKELVAPSMEKYQDMPKASYMFVIVNENDENKLMSSNMTTVMQCYKEYGKYEDNADVLRVIIETLDGRPLANNTKIEFMQNKCNELIQGNSKNFLKVITDKMLSTKVLIRKAVDAGIISKRGNFYYIKEDNTPMCENNEEPILSAACEFLNAPKRQDLMLSIQAKLK